MLDSIKNSNPDDFLRYVRKNTKLNEIRAYAFETEEGAGLLKELHSALISKNSNASIFSHPYAIMFTQILFEQNKISESDRMGIFLYLTILRTYTDKQELRDEDADVKVLCPVEAIMSSDERYKDIISDYLGRVFSSLVNPARRNALQVPVSKRFLLQMQPLIEKALNGSGFEFAIFRISMPIDSEQVKHLSYHSLRQHANEDIMFWAQYGENEQTIILPSAGLFQGMMQQLNPEINFELAPILGRIGTETLFKNFHTVKKHAVSIYSEHVKSNLSEVHGLRLGPLGALLHDIFHITMFDVMFDKKMYEFFSIELIPFMIKLNLFFQENINNQEDNCKINGALDSLLAFLNDYLVESPDFYRRLFVNIFERINETIISDPKKPALFMILFLAFSRLSDEDLEYYSLERLEINQVKGASILPNLIESVNFPNKPSNWNDKHFDHVYSSHLNIESKNNKVLTFSSEVDIGIKRGRISIDFDSEGAKQHKNRKI